MNYINTETGEYPLTEMQVREKFPNVSFKASDFPPAPFAQVHPTDPPTVNPSAEDAVRAAPAQVGGVWREAWSVVPAADAAARLAAHRAFQWEAIKAERDRLQLAGCLVGDEWFHNDVKSRGQWERMVNRVEQDGMNDADFYLIAGQQVPWKKLDGTFVVLTAGKIRAVVAAMEVREAAIFSVAEYHRGQLALSANPLSYDFSAGWPAEFQ